MTDVRAGLELETLTRPTRATDRVAAILDGLDGDTPEEKVASLPEGRQRRSAERALAKAQSVRATRMDVWTHETETSPPDSLVLAPGALFIGADGSWWRRAQDGWVEVK